MLIVVLISLVATVSCHISDRHADGVSQELDLPHRQSIHPITKSEVLPGQELILANKTAVKRYVDPDCVNGVSLRSGRRCFVLDLVGGMIDFGTGIASKLFNEFVRCPVNSFLQLVAGTSKCKCKCHSSVFTCKARVECGMPKYKKKKTFRLRDGCILCQYLMRNKCVCLKMKKCVKKYTKAQLKLDIQIMTEITSQIKYQESESDSASSEDNGDEGTCFNCLGYQADNDNDNQIIDEN